MELFQQVSELTKPVTKHFEGLRLEPYRDLAGFWTVGWGHRCPDNQKAITEVQAEFLLTEDLKKAFDQLTKKSPALLSEKPGRLGALTDFVFNLGIGRYQDSTLCKYVNLGDFEHIPEFLRKWVYGSGKVLPGLVLRRSAEIALWNL